MRNVYNYNAVGVIVYNDRDSQNLDKMQILDRDRKLFKSGHIFTSWAVKCQSSKSINDPCPPDKEPIMPISPSCTQVQAIYHLIVETVSAFILPFLK